MQNADSFSQFKPKLKTFRDEIKEKEKQTDKSW